MAEKLTAWQGLDTTTSAQVEGMPWAWGIYNGGGAKKQ